MPAEQTPREFPEKKKKKCARRSAITRLTLFIGGLTLRSPVGFGYLLLYGWLPRSFRAVLHYLQCVGTNRPYILPVCWFLIDWMRLASVSRTVPTILSRFWCLFVFLNENLRDTEEIISKETQYFKWSNRSTLINVSNMCFTTGVSNYFWTIWINIVSYLINNCGLLE